MRIVVASTSGQKLGPVTQECRRIFQDEHETVSIMGVPAESGVPEQPIGMAQTYQGAMQRINSAQRLSSGADLYIGIENGIVEVSAGLWIDLAIVVLQETRTSRVVLSSSQGVQIPGAVVQKMMSNGGPDRLHCGRVIATHQGCPPNDPHSALTNGEFSRAQLIQGAVRAALAELKSPALEALSKLS